MTPFNGETLMLWELSVFVSINNAVVGVCFVP